MEQENPKKISLEAASADADAMQQVQRTRQRKQKIIKGVLIFCAVVVILSAIFSMIDPDALVDQMFGKQNENEKKNEIYFYEADYEEDIFQNESYAQLDHRLFFYGSDGTLTSVEEEDLATAEDEILFFYAYFDAAIRGNTQEYATFFSEEYLATGEVPEEFTMQMIYDIRVYPEFTTEDGNEGQGFRVEYMIHRNNGTLRSDIGSDACRSLYMVLEYIDGHLKIVSVRPYTTYEH